MPFSCPKDPDHKTFTATFLATQEWKINADGDREEMLEETNADMQGSPLCEECGEAADGEE